MTEVKVPLFPSMRLGVLLLTLLLISLTLGNFASLNFAWICMIGNTTNTSCTDKENRWNNPEDKSLLFAATSWGAAIYTPIAGYFMNRFGARLVSGTSACVGGIATLLIPLLSQLPDKTGLALVVLARVLVGMCGGSTWPTAYSVCSNWMPAKELGTGIAITSSGILMGQLIVMLISGVLCSYLCWQSVFYIFGGASVGAGICWFVLYRNDVALLSTSRLLTEAEKNLIVTSRPQQRNATTGRRVPWCRIFTSIPVWSCALSGVAYTWILFFIGENMPTYLNDVLGLSQQNAGFLVATPFFSIIVGRYLAGPISDLKWPLPRSAMTKVFNTAGFMCAAGCLIGLGFVPKAVGFVLPVVLLNGVMFSCGFLTAGYVKNPVQLAPEFSAVIGGLVNSAGYAASIGLPYVLSAFLSAEGSRGWENSFFVAAAISVLAAVVFMALGSAKKQYWADDADYKSTVTTIKLDNLGSISTIAGAL